MRLIAESDIAEMTVLCNGGLLFFISLLIAVIACLEFAGSCRGITGRPLCTVWRSAYLSERCLQGSGHIYSPARRPLLLIILPLRVNSSSLPFSGGREFNTCAFKALMIVYHGTRVWSRILQVLPRVKESAGVASLYPTSYTFLNILYTYRM